MNPNELIEAIENNQGFCTDCLEFTRDCTEPDAEGYDCPVCEKNTVIGGEILMLNMM